MTGLINLFGETEAEPASDSKIRTKSGDLSSATLKAISWFAIDNQLKLTSTSALPTMSFIDIKGEIQKFPIDDIVQQYKDFKKASHGNQHA
jgi:hypothetical protein